MRKRTTFQSSDELEDILDKLAILTNRKTKSEVITDSLELYQILVDEVTKGSIIYTSGPTRMNLTRITSVALENTRKNAQAKPNR